VVGGGSVAVMLMVETELFKFDSFSWPKHVAAKTVNTDTVRQVRSTVYVHYV
jgi:hypothetical protein